METGSNSPHLLSVYLGMLAVHFEVIEPVELVDLRHRLIERYQRAVTPRTG